MDFRQPRMDRPHRHLDRKRGKKTDKNQYLRHEAQPLPALPVDVPQGPPGVAPVQRHERPHQQENRSFRHTTTVRRYADMAKTRIDPNPLTRLRYPDNTPGRLTLISRLRNPHLAQLLYDTAYMERAGTGISRMIRAMQEHRLEPPIFEEVANSLQVTLHGPEFGQEPVAPSLVLNSLASPEIRASLNERQLRFLAVLLEKRQMSRKEYEATFEVSERTANNDLQGLVRKGLVTTVGTSVRTQYILNNSQ